MEMRLSKLRVMVWRVWGDCNVHVHMLVWAPITCMPGRQVAVVVYLLPPALALCHSLSLSLCLLLPPSPSW